MPMPPRSACRRIAIGLFAFCFLHPVHAAPDRQAGRLDEMPMYGGPERFQQARIADPALKAADEKLIADASARWGSREQAARAWIEQAYAFYGQNKPGMAMRRFNQAWLLDPSNSQVYAGFAAVLHDQDRVCEAMAMMDKALSLSPPTNQGMLADAARVVTLCAVSHTGLSAQDRDALYKRSQDLYVQAEKVETNKGYVYYSWATANYWQGNYDAAWQMVARARAHGTEPNIQFMRMLSAKMPAPQPR